MKNMREMMSNALVIGGLLTTAGSAVDAIVNKEIFRNMTRALEIENEVGREYGVNHFCLGDLGTNTVTCTDTVYGNHTKEEEAKILDQYSSENYRRQAANRLPLRGSADMAGALTGIGMYFLGLMRKQRR